MIPIRKFTASAGKLRLEFDLEGRRCAAMVRPTHVVLQDGGQMAIAIEQEPGGVAVACWNPDGSIDAAAPLAELARPAPAKPRRRRRV